MKDYYEILGVSPFAHAADIKRAYRKLALLYHPDRNADPAAEILTREINEAYDILSDPEKKLVYDLKRSNAFAEDNEPVGAPHRDPAYRKRQGTPGPKRKTERERMLEMMAGYYVQARWMIFGSLAFCLLLLADYALPQRSETDRIKDITYSKQVVARDRNGGQISANYIQFENAETIKIDAMAGEHFEVGKLATVNRSTIIGIPFTLKAEDGFLTEVPVTIYGSFIFGPIVLAMTALAGLWLKQNKEMTFNLGVACFFVLILNFVFILLS